MYRYLIYGIIVESEVEFMQLLKADENIDLTLLQDGCNNGRADLTIHQGDCKDEVMDYLEKKDCLKRRYSIGLEYSAFFNKGGYYIIKNGNEIIFEMKEGYTTAIVSGWLLGFAMTMALLQKRVLAIHCSAVTADDGAFIISGEPGAGKSSLTRKLLERDYKIMADDVAAVKIKDDHAVVYPAFPFQKLCRNEVESRNFDMNELIYIGEDKDKFLVPVKDKFVAQPQKLKFMLFLRKGDVDEVIVKKLSGLEQLMAIRQNVFLHKLSGEWENFPEVLNLALAIAGHCPVYMIIRPVEGNSQDIMADLAEKINNGEEI